MVFYLESKPYYNKCFVGGKFFNSKSTEKINSISPLNGSVITDFPSCNKDDLDATVIAASEAFNKGLWRNLPLEKKQVALLKLAELIQKNRKEIAYLETIDTGKPIKHSLNIDIPATVQCIKWYANIIDKVYDRSFQYNQKEKIFIDKYPIGVVAAIIPWNFPSYIAALKFAPALAMGNSVIIKPSEKASLSLLYIASLVEKIREFPPGVFNLVTGGPYLGECIGRHPKIDCISFTGSTQVGKNFLMYSAESNMKNVFLECGGKSPAIIMGDAINLENIAKQITFNVFFNQGAVCGAPVKVIAEKVIEKQLIKFLIEQSKNFIPANPLDLKTNMGAIIDKEQMEKITSFISISIKEQEQILTGGKSINPVKGGYYIEPTIIQNFNDSSSVATEEIFGPVISIETYNSSSDLPNVINKINDSKYGLSASIFSKDLNKALLLGQDIRVGNLSINKITDGNIINPFGGFRQSGIGRDRSLEALNNYSEIKTTWVSYGE